MISEYFANKLAQNIINLGYISRASGCVTDIDQPIGKTIIKKIPGAEVVYGAAGIGAQKCNIYPLFDKYYPMIPDKEENAIVFFKDLGSDLVEQGRVGDVWKGKIKMNIWVNFIRVSEDDGMNKVTHGISSFINSMGHLFTVQEDWFLKGDIYLSKLLPMNHNPYEEYDLDIENSKYNMLPNITRSYELSWTAIIKPLCAADVGYGDGACPDILPG